MADRSIQSCKKCDTLIFRFNKVNVFCLACSTDFIALEAKKIAESHKENLKKICLSDVLSDQEENLLFRRILND